ncbi:MAG: IS30 family transposase [Pseudomonadales bacterium]|nr:IS30 family transposase [Pseudomonadales bacterium]
MKPYQQLSQEERFYIWNALRNGSSQKAVAEALDLFPSTIYREIKRHKDKVKILTSDNGSEFVLHEKVTRTLDTETYFAHPYSSWARGIIEKTNGLLRQFFLKKFDFCKVSWKGIKDAVNNLNNRPRKT